jgi:hypothetical protein
MLRAHPDAASTTHGRLWAKDANGAGRKPAAQGRSLVECQTVLRIAYSQPSYGDELLAVDHK